MKEGMSYLQLYYNKACTRELEKDVDGNYIYKSNNISNNAVMPLIVNLWCKNNGSHTAYETTLKLVSADIDVVLPPIKDKIYSMQIVALPVKITILKNDNKQHNIVLRFEYDSI